MKVQKTALTLFIFYISFYSLQAHVSLEFPKGGETFKPGSSETLKWKETIDHGDNNWDIYLSLDGGETWSEIALDIEESILEYEWAVPFTNTSKAVIKVIQDNLNGNSYEDQSGIFSISTSSPGGEPGDVITGLSEPIQTETDLKLSIYPNPFHQSTTIRFYLPRQSNIHLGIYSIDGKLISQKLDGIYSAGKHELAWERADLPAGMYICKLRVGQTAVTTKMIYSP